MRCPLCGTKGEEVAALRRRVDKVEAEEEHYYIKSELLRQALEKYGRHLDDCHRRPCTCGYHDALFPKKKGPPE